MKRHNHRTGGAGHGHNDKRGHAPPKKKGIHKDWRAWTAVVLMLAAMVIYVLSFDESLQPGVDIEQETPVAEEDAGE